jgi:sterol desaturase/sphingolipid hydroxylase (fatty acid hydroxylase superfamily)
MEAARPTPLSILRHPHLGRVAWLFGPAALAFLGLGAWVAQGGPLTAPGGFLYGLLWWSLIEYVLHRWVLHWEPADPRGRAIRRHLPGHRSHHDGPQDPDDVVSRKHAFALPLGAIGLGAMLAVGFSWGWALAAVGGGALGYALYEYVHFACPQLPMTSRIGRVLRRHHAIHHHRDETVNFGVTSPLWDHVFGTAWKGGR